MRRQDTWLSLAKRLAYDPSHVVAVCAFLNIKRDPAWICDALDLPEFMVARIAKAANPLLRHPREPKKAPKGLSCAYCGATENLSRDHVIPRSRGGAHHPSNFVLACLNCNAAKGDRTPDEWLGGAA